MVEFEWDNIVIGNTLEAILYAYENKSHFINDGDFPYLPCDLLKKEIELPNYKAFKNSEIGSVCRDIYFYLSLQGHAPLSFNTKKIVKIYPKENRLRVMLGDFERISIKFNNLKIFSSSILLEPKIGINYFEVIDRFDFIQKEKIEDFFLKSEYDFVNKIRVLEGNLYVYSNIATDEIKSEEFSIINCRLDTIEMLKENDKPSDILHKQRDIRSVYEEVCEEYEKNIILDSRKKI